MFRHNQTRQSTPSRLVWPQHGRSFFGSGLVHVMVSAALLGCAAEVGAQSPTGAGVVEARVAAAGAAEAEVAAAGAAEPAAAAPTAAQPSAAAPDEASGVVRAPGSGMVCEAGRISAIEVRNGSVFDASTTSSRALRWTFGLANSLHVRTRESFIRDELLVREGECADAIQLRESARLLEAYPTLRDVRIEAVPDGAGGRRLIVTTWDEWSTQFDAGVTWDAGANLEKLQVTERNFLGRAMFAEYTYRRRREISEQALGFSTPRFFGRANFGFTVGRRRAGDFIHQKLTYPFVGEVGRISAWQHHEYGSRFFSWATGAGASWAAREDGVGVGAAAAEAGGASHVLVGVTTERTELSVARQFGAPGRLSIVGLGLVREAVGFAGQADLALNDDFDDRADAEVPEVVRGQLRPIADTRLELRLGLRRFHSYERFERLDNMGTSRPVPLGWFASLTLGHSVPLLVPELPSQFATAVDGPGKAAVDRPGAAAADGAGGAAVDGSGGGGLVTRVHAMMTREMAGAGGGSALLHGSFTGEARRDAGQWNDVLAQADVALYLPLHRAHTLFLRTAAAAGQRVSRPFQLALGGREGVRSLPDDAWPGGQMVRFTLEDRIHPAFASLGAADLGVAVFTDVGRMWAGDVPFGRDSGWQAGIGGGLRIAAPSGSRNVTRVDLVLPVGATTGSPILRITAELNTLGSGFGTSRLIRSFRMLRAAEHF